VTGQTGREKLLVALKIPVRGQSGPPIDERRFLRPVPTIDASPQDPDVRLLTDARNANREAFLTEFDATPEQTARWLREVVAPDPARVLFAVQERDGPTLGFLGLRSIDLERSSGEFDAVLRASTHGGGAMRDAVVALIDWGRNTLGLASFSLRVRSDNEGACRFYAGLGFVTTRRVPLRRERDRESSTVTWIEDELADTGCSVLYQELPPS
jgi:RimJ/RimL family protein N-acetyltransferase